MKLPKSINHSKVKKIVDVASGGIDVMQTIKISGEQGSIIASIAKFARLKKKKIPLSHRIQKPKMKQIIFH